MARIRSATVSSTEFPIRGAIASLFVLTSVQVFAAGEATYNGVQPDQFMKRWLILKPIPVAAKGTPGTAAQKKAFAEDQLAALGREAKAQPSPGMKVTIGGKEYEWRLVESADDIVDLRKGSAGSDFAIAYAWAEIEMLADSKDLLGIGSADGVKVWLNGKPIHQNWVGRPAYPLFEDAVPVEWRRGKNQLLLKIQNVRGPWNFTCRFMSRMGKAEALVNEAGESGDVDAVKRLLELGEVDVNALNSRGVSALHAARMKGNAELAEYLLTRGADLKIGRPATETLINEDFNSFVGSNEPGVAVLVGQNGKVLFAKGYGLADVEHKVAITPETKFRIGSITKQFTAALILKLQEEGKLSVTDKLSKYIPDFPRGGEVTLAHLLTHTSGIPDYERNEGFRESITTAITIGDLVKSFQNDPYDFDPGRKWQYSNSGYVLLAYIIEKVTGNSYEDFLRKTFLIPLHMSNTGVHRSDAAPKNAALGYQRSGGKFKRSVNADLSRYPGAGAIHSTVEDLFLWNEGIFNGKVVSEASLKAAFTPVKTDGNIVAEDGYGFGWFVTAFRGSQEIQHSGSLPGFSSYLMRLQKEKFTVVVLTNVVPGIPGDLAHRATEFYLGEQLAPRYTNKRFTITAKALDAIAGYYDYDEDVLKVTVDGGKAYVELSERSVFEIFPKSETEFFYKVGDGQITFVNDESGKVVKAIHFRSGHTTNAPRMDVFLVDTESLDAILGKYDYGEDGKLTVTRDGDEVFAQFTGQPKSPIYPKSATEFFWRMVDAQITFVKDASGKVTKAIHQQDGEKTDAKKIE